MRLVKLLAISLLVLIVAMIAISFFLPAQQGTERHRDINAPAEKLWPLIVSPKQWARWSAWNRRDPGMTIRYEGPESGAGAKWSWDSASQGKGAMVFDAAEPNKQLTYTLTFPDMGSAATGRIVLTPQGNGTRVTWSFETSLGNNPVMRWFGLMIPGMVGKDFDEGLANLEEAAK